MNTQTKRGTRHLAASLAIAIALASSCACAGTTTYYQVAGTGDCTSLISLDGLPSNTEITSEPQLAFPGMTLDDIPERASFFTTLYGEDIVTSSISVGAHEQRHYTDGHADKIALQFVVSDSKMKGVTLALTNGDGGVYVQMVRRFSKGGWYFHNKYYSMDATGVIGTNFLNEGDYLDGSWTSGEEGDFGFQASGLKVHGMSVAASGKAKGLAFPGVRLADIKDCSFVAGYRIGRNTNVPVTNNVAKYVTAWPDSTNPQKLVMQFEHPTDSKKSAIVQMTNGVDGVYAFQSHHTWNGNNNIQRFGIDETTGAVSANNTGGSSGTTSNDPPEYPVHELFLLPPCVKKTPTKVWSSGDPLHPLKLDDIKDGVFGSRFFGAWVTDKNYYRYTPNSATGTIEAGSQIEDASGSITNMVVWFEIPEGRKRVKVMFEYREDGIYATGIEAKCESNTGSTFVETYEGNGYALCDLRVTVPNAVWMLDGDKTWSELRNGATLDHDEVVRIKVVDNDAVLTVDENVVVSQIAFSNGGGSTLVIADGATLTVDDISGINNVVNNGTLVKTGDDTVAWPFNNASTGVTVVSNGTLKASSKTGTGTAHVVRVTSGATFDMNGIGDLNLVVRLEEGAHFVNNAANIGNTTSQAVRLALDGDATATAGKNFGLLAPALSDTFLELGSNTLTLDGTGGFWLCNTTITGDGTIAVESGTLQCARGDAIGENCTLNIGASAEFRIDGTKSLCVSNFCNGGKLQNGNVYGGTAYGTVVVNGTLTSGNALTNLTLTSGAAVKATGTVQVVSGTFTATGEYTVDASDITKAQLNAAEGQRVPVMTVPTADKGGVWSVANPLVPGCRAKWLDNGDGTSTLYVAKPTGLMVVFR